MPNFEGSPNGNENDRGNGEIPRDEARERGEKTEDAIRAEEERKARLEQEEREALEELERLKAERAKLVAEFGEPVSEGDSEPDSAAPAAETTGEKSSREKTYEKAKQKSGLKKFLTGAAIVVLAGVIASGVFLATHRDKNTNTTLDSNPISATDTIETTKPAEAANPLVGELENGTSYDYTHYADRHIEWNDDGTVAAYVTAKEAWNAYDYDYSADFNNREAAEQSIMDVARRSPEALASYAYGLFTDAEKEELGIAGMSMTEIDDYMSNHKNGGEMQARLLEKLGTVLHDERTNFNFYYEDDTEDTNYIYWVDDNNDGTMNPTELHLGYDTRDRKGAPQVDIYRSFLESSDKNGDYYTSKKMLDLNMSCGYQPNYEKDEVPSDVPYVPADQADPGSGAEGTGSEGTGSEGTGSEGTGSEGTGSEGTGSEGTGSEGTGSEGTGSEGTGSEGTGSEGTGSETTEWGKSGDPHTGDLVDVSDLVDPNSVVSQGQSENANQGNQGYVDDQQAAPGASSENNGVDNTGFAATEIVAPGATTEGETRLQGGENQGTQEMAGENAYHSEESIATGQAIDKQGDAAQEEAQSTGGENGSGAAVGGDNYSDAAEEEAVASGDF